MLPVYKDDDSYKASKSKIKNTFFSWIRWFYYSIFIDFFIFLF